MTTQTNTIQFKLVQKYASYNSDFCEFLAMEFDADTAKRIVSDYALGAIDGKTILWNIGTDGRVYDGMVIAFDTNGRIKNPWLESMMATHSYEDISLMGWYVKETGFQNDVISVSDFLSPDLGTGDLPYKVIERASLFGLHLLKMYPQRPIALTESPKSALIGYALQPNMNWLAIGCDVKDMDFNILRPLRGKRVVVFPSNHNYRDWLKVAKQVDFCQIVVSDMMEGYKSDWLRDIGDLLLDDFRRNGEQVTPTKKEPQPAIVVQISPKQKILNDMIASNPALGTLVSNLNLQIV